MEFCVGQSRGIGIDFSVAIGIDAGIIACAWVDSRSVVDFTRHVFGAIDFDIARFYAVAAVALAARIAVVVVVFVGIDRAVAVVVETEIERLSVFGFEDGADSAFAFAPIDVVEAVVFVNGTRLLAVFANAFACCALGIGITLLCCAWRAFARGGERLATVGSVSVAIDIAIGAFALFAVANHIRSTRLVASATV